MSAAGPASNWHWMQLEEICDIEMGQSPASDSYNTAGQGEPLLNGPSEFGDQHPTARQWTVRPTQFAEVGDILFCVRGATTGRKNIADRRYCIGRGLAAIRAKPNEAHTSFVWFLLDVVTVKLLERAAGSTFINLPGEALKRFPVRVPDLAEQKRIAAMLNEQMRQAEILNSQAIAAHHDSLHACDALYRDLFQDRLRKCTRIPLGTVVRGIEGGKSFQSLERPPLPGEYAVLKVSAMSWNEFDPSAVKALPADFVPPETHLVRKGDFLISRANTKELVGAAVIVREEHPNLVLSDKSLRLVLDTSKVLPEFLLFALRLPEARSFIENNATGSSSSMRNISQDKIKLVPVPITDFDLQARLVETVQRLEVQRSKLVDSSRKQFEAISALPAAYLRLAFARQF